MTTYAFPTISRNPAKMSWGLRSNATIFISMLNGGVQTVELPGARWTLSIEIPDCIDTLRGSIEAWLTKLRGQANRFTCYDFSCPAPRGTMRGTLVTVGSTTQGTTSVTVSGGVGEASKTLLAGDKLKIGNELKMIVADATANGSGVISLTVEPPFRATYADSTAIVWDKPTALFLLTSNEWKADIDPPARAHFAIDGLEVFS
jgi:hypothetical protein